MQNQSPFQQFLTILLKLTAAGTEVYIWSFTRAAAIWAVRSRSTIKNRIRLPSRILIGIKSFSPAFAETEPFLKTVYYYLKLNKLHHLQLLEDERNFLGEKVGSLNAILSSANILFPLPLHYTYFILSRNKYPRMPKEIRNPLRCFPIPIQIYPRFTFILTGYYFTILFLNFQANITPLLCGEFSGFCIEKKDMHVKILEKRLKTMGKGELLEEFYSGSLNRHILIEFLSPTSFKSDGKYLIIPEIRHLYQSRHIPQTGTEALHIQ